jgi:hypothetical protein
MQEGVASALQARKWTKWGKAAVKKIDTMHVFFFCMHITSDKF